MAAQNYGRVVNVSSRMGQIEHLNDYAPSYRLSKLLLNGMTRILADAVRGKNVLVNAVCPGWVRTDMGGAGASRSLEQGASGIVWAATLPAPGLQEAGYLTNETVFSLTERPGRLVIIGAGPIGCEMAQAFARLGSQVTIVSLDRQLLPREDADAGRLLTAVFEREGIDLRLGAVFSGAAAGNGAAAGSFAVVFAFVLPRIAAGTDPILVSIAAAAIIIPVSFYLSHGLNRKTTSAVIPGLSAAEKRFTYQACSRSNSRTLRMLRPK